MAFLAPAVPFLSAAGLGLSTVGMIEQGSAASKQAQYQAQVAQNNSLIAQRNAQQALSAGQTRAMNESMKGAQKLARVKVAQAASGIDINSGSAVDVQAGEAETDRLDTLTIMHNAMLDAYGYKTQATNDEAQAGLYRAEGSDALTGAFLRAGGSLLGGASSLSDKWGSLKGSGSSSVPEWEGWGNDEGL